LIKKTYSTVQVSKLLNVSWSTLHRWIELRKIAAPPLQTLGGMQVRLWSEEDVSRVRRYKAEHYRKKPNRKRKKTAKDIK
jgi:DNA-binding transcriptional MerR regulator